MKCYMTNCTYNNEWACMYRSDCRECNRGCKNYYQCSSCDYYMDEYMEEDFRGQRANMSVYEDYSGLFSMVQVGGSNGIDPALLDKFNSLGYTTYIIPTEVGKPIKLVFENCIEENDDGAYIEIRKKFHGIEAEKIITDIFGTTNIGAFKIEEESK